MRVADIIIIMIIVHLLLGRTRGHQPCNESGHRWVYFFNFFFLLVFGTTFLRLVKKIETEKRIRFFFYGDDGRLRRAAVYTRTHTMSFNPLLLLLLSSLLASLLLLYYYYCRHR